MMTAPSTAPVPTFELVDFQGSDIMAARCDAGDGRDRVYVPMKRFCGSVGLPWDSARRRIDRDEVLREGAVMMTVPSEGGAQLQQTLPLDLIPGFLMGADASRYAPEIRERVKTFRRECYDVLHSHFFGMGSAPVTIVPTPAPLPAIDVDRHQAIANALGLVARLRTEAPGPVRILCQQLLGETCATLGLEAPLVAQDAPAGPTASQRIDALLTALQTLDGRRVAYNHLGREAHGRIALNLPQLARLFAQHDIDVQVDDALRAALEAGDHRYRVVLRSIDSHIARFAKTTLCHVIERAL